MKLFFPILLMLPLSALAHPAIGIVKDSKGNIYYTDLQNVWKISNGKKSIIVRDVHTHELYIDKQDNLYGEGGDYVARTEKFYHFLWRYRGDGRIDTIIGMKEAYITQDFSLARDSAGNEYYTKQYLKPFNDTTHIYHKTPGGAETVWATGNFKGVPWLHVQDDGSILYVQNNSLYRVDNAGRVQLVKQGLANKKPSFGFSGEHAMVWGVWQDAQKNIYIAAFSDQSVKKIDTAGNMTIVYRATGKWAPLHGVVDNNGKLWVLEGSDKNEVRVSEVKAATATTSETDINDHTFFYLSIAVVAIIGIVVALKASKGTKVSHRDNRAL